MPSLKQYSGPIFVFIIATLPLVLWYFASPTQPSFSTFANTLRSLGQACAVLGGAFFCINFILTTRLKFLEKLFVGLNKIYVWHHYFGAIAFVLLLFHPTLLGLQYLPISVRLVAEFFIPPISEWATWFGIAALLVVIVLLVITFYIRLNYQTWKSTHKYLGLGLGLASVHMFFITGNLSENVLLKIYMLALAGSALAAFMYRVVLMRWLVPKYVYKVQAVNTQHQVNELVLAPMDKAMNYQPGQFVFIEPISLGVKKEQHPFSFTSNPSEPNIIIASKAVGDFTQQLNLVRAGDIVNLEGPYGAFSYLNYERKKQLWIAGGIGITPFLSMAKTLPEHRDYDALLIYSVKDMEEAVFNDVLDSITKETANFRMNIYESKKSGRLDAEKIGQMVTDLEEREVFLCGPPPMMVSLRAQLRKIGKRNSAIHSEEFALY